ncbi:MAG TPA: hypothetical protein VLJ17_19785 [Xanthobacteraceae bacterium]|nr:hypothetical protein [Xanthobacteraceae bacterium]
MMLAHKIALDPTNNQRTYFARACGAVLLQLRLSRMGAAIQGGEPSEAALRSASGLEIDTPSTPAAALMPTILAILQRIAQVRRDYKITALALSAFR